MLDAADSLAYSVKRHFLRFIRNVSIQHWGSEYLTSLVFIWLKRGWMPNGLVLECHLNTGQMDVILLFKYWSSIQKVSVVHRTIALDRPFQYRTI